LRRFPDSAESIASIPRNSLESKTDSNCRNGFCAGFCQFLGELLDTNAQAGEEQAGKMQLHGPLQDGDALARIPARTERRAMEWSLVLASQSIDATIQNDPETGWSLLVSVAAHESALAAITQYRRENARWPWQQPVMSTGTVFDWASAVWVALTCIFFQLEITVSNFREVGIVDSAAINRGHWWRLFTAEFLHADTLHLAANGVFGLILLGFAMGRFGTGIATLAAFVAGAAGNYFSLLLHEGNHQALGASGMVMAALGLLAAPSIAEMRSRPRGWKIVVGGVAVGVMLFTLLGLHPGTDISAHFGGFVAGLVFGAILAPFHKLPRKPLLNLMCGLLVAGLIIWTWSLALRH
jgi:rhomboid protease GluP